MENNYPKQTKIPEESLSLEELNALLLKLRDEESSLQAFYKKRLKEIDDKRSRLNGLMMTATHRPPTNPGIK